MLVGRPPTTVASLMRACSVTHTAVMQQLNDLVAKGMSNGRLMSGGPVVDGPGIVTRPPIPRCCCLPMVSRS